MPVPASLLLAIGAHVFEEQIAEDHVRDAVAPCASAIAAAISRS